MQSRRSFLQAGIVAASTSTFGALAQDAKPLSIIVGFPPEARRTSLRER